MKTIIKIESGVERWKRLSARLFARGMILFRRLQERYGVSRSMGLAANPRFRLSESGGQGSQAAVRYIDTHATKRFTRLKTIVLEHHLAPELGLPDAHLKKTGKNRVAADPLLNTRPGRVEEQSISTGIARSVSAPNPGYTIAGTPVAGSSGSVTRIRKRVSAGHAVDDESPGEVLKPTGNRAEVLTRNRGLFDDFRGPTKRGEMSIRTTEQILRMTTRFTTTREIIQPVIRENIHARFSVGSNGGTQSLPRDFVRRVGDVNAPGEVVSRPSTSGAPERKSGLAGDARGTGAGESFKFSSSLRQTARNRKLQAFAEQAAKHEGLGSAHDPNQAREVRGEESGSEGVESVQGVWRELLNDKSSNDMAVFADRIYREIEKKLYVEGDRRAWTS